MAPNRSYPAWLEQQPGADAYPQGHMQRTVFDVAPQTFAPLTPPDDDSSSFDLRLPPVVLPPGAFMEYGFYSPPLMSSSWQPGPEDAMMDDRYVAHRPEPFYDYFGIPILTQKSQQQHAPTPPYSPLYSPTHPYSVQQTQPPHQQHYEQPVPQHRFIAPNDVHLAHPPPSSQASFQSSWRPQHHERYYGSEGGSRRSSSSDAAYIDSQQPNAWHHGEAPPSPGGLGGSGASWHGEIDETFEAPSPRVRRDSEKSLDPKMQEASTPFITKLSHLLNNPEYETFIRWSNRGNCFIFAHNSPLLFAAFSRFFRHSNCQSFVRQLNIYGFTRLNSTELHATMASSQLASHPLPPDESSAFIHPRFFRDSATRPCPAHLLKPRVPKKKPSLLLAVDVAKAESGVRRGSVELAGKKSGAARGVKKVLVPKLKPGLTKRAARMLGDGEEAERRPSVSSEGEWFKDE